MAWTSGRSISNPVVAMTDAMRTLADGDTNAEVPARDRARRDRRDGRRRPGVQGQHDRRQPPGAEQAKEQEPRSGARRSSTSDRPVRVKMTDVVKIVASASTELQATAQSLSATAEETSKQSGTVAAASEQASANVQTVATAAEELTSSISEIARQVATSTQISGQAVAEADAPMRRSTPWSRPRRGSARSCS